MGSARSVDLERYHEWTRNPSVAFACLLPLLAVYEIGIMVTGGSARNSAEQFLKGLSGFGELATWAIHALFAIVLIVAIQVWRRDVPLLRLYPLLLVESFVCAALLGPVAGQVVTMVGLESPVVSVSLTEQILLSLGAGIYEELVFRFLLLAGTFSLLHRVLEIERTPAVVIAVLGSATMFAIYHHLGPFGEPLRVRPLLFRFVAGIVLGALFVFRGLAVCVYLHAWYDVMCDLQAADPA